MKSLALFSPSRGLLVALVSTAPAIGLAGDLVLQKAPPLTVQEAPAYPQNLARFHLGAAVTAKPQSVPLSKLQLSSQGQDQNTAEAALLCDDPTTGYRLSAGTTTIVISLANIENVQSLSFQSEEAEGGFDVAISNADVPASSPEWRKAGAGQIIDGAVATRIGPGEAKYVRLNFHATKPGRVAALGVYATPALSDFTMPRPSKVSFEEETADFALINFNYSDVHARARALYASSGNLVQANNMLDDQPATVYRFAPGDPNPTTVIDLGQARSLTRLSAVYASQPGSVEFYVLHSLPQTSSSDPDVRQVTNAPQSADLPASLHLNQETISGLKPVGSVVSTGEGRAAVDFPEVTGRYVMLKWHPASVQGEPFSIAQVAAFGPNRRTGPNGQVYDGKDGKDIFEDKNIPAEAAAPEEGPPPALPPVPPFTFIPQVPPTSP